MHQRKAVQGLYCNKRDSWQQQREVATHGVEPLHASNLWALGYMATLTNLTHACLFQTLQ